MALQNVVRGDMMVLVRVMEEVVKTLQMSYFYFTITKGITRYHIDMNLKSPLPSRTSSEAT